MKKWSFLVATLLMLSATATTFTSCVNTDEPEGITILREAKAGYLAALSELKKAEAQTEAAKVTVKNAEAAFKLAEAEVEKAKAEVQKAEAAKAQAEAEKIRLEAEAAKNLADAELIEKIAEAETAKAEAELAIAQAQADLEALKISAETQLLDAKTELANAQETYEKLLKAIDLRKLVASDAELEVLQTAQLRVSTATTALTTAAADLQDAQEDYLDTVYGMEDAAEALADRIANDEKNIADLDAKLNANYAAIDQLKKAAEAATLADIDNPTKFDAQFQAIEDSINALKAANVDLAVKQKEIENSDAYKALKDAKKAAEDKAILLRNTTDPTKKGSTAESNKIYQDSIDAVKNITAAEVKVEYADYVKEKTTPALKNVTVAKETAIEGTDKAQETLQAALNNVNKVLASYYSSEAKAVYKEWENTDLSTAKNQAKDDVKAWEDALKKYTSSKDYVKEATDGKSGTLDVLKAAIKKQNDAISAAYTAYHAAGATTAQKNEAYSAAKTAYAAIADALVTYYKAADAKVGLKTASVRFTDPSMKDAAGDPYTGDILSLLSSTTKGVYVQILVSNSALASYNGTKKVVDVPGANSIVEVSHALTDFEVLYATPTNTSAEDKEYLISEGSVAANLAAVQSASTAAFGSDFLNIQEAASIQNGYARVKPTDAELENTDIYPMADRADAGKVGSYGLAYYKEKSTSSEFWSNYEQAEKDILAAKATFEAAIAANKEILKGNEAEVKRLTDAKDAAAKAIEAAAKVQDGIAKTNSDQMTAMTKEVADAQTNNTEVSTRLGNVKEEIKNAIKFYLDESTWTDELSPAARLKAFKLDLETKACQLEAENWSKASCSDHPALVPVAWNDCLGKKKGDFEADLKEALKIMERLEANDYADDANNFLMLKAETALANAQASYDDAVKEYELATAELKKILTAIYGE